MSGDPNKPPVRIPVPQAYLHAGSWGASACLIALHQQRRTGKGQFIDTSVHEAATWSSYMAQENYAFSGKNIRRQGRWRQDGKCVQQVVYQCKDGFVVFNFFVGRMAQPGQRYLIEQMIKEGTCPDRLKDLDFSKLDASTMHGIS